MEWYQNVVRRLKRDCLFASQEANLVPFFLEFCYFPPAVKISLSRASGNMWIQNQRVISRTEPELGIGLVKDIKHGEWVEIHFPLVGEARRYGVFTPPIQRFLLRPGQNFVAKNGSASVVQEILEESGIVQYITNTGRFSEIEMDHRLHDVGTVEALLNGQLTDFATYELRKEAWNIKRQYQSSQAFGVIGPRVQPIAHQLYITKEVVARTRPRVLLADEVGLGKTIEAGLIMSALRVRGKADRILIVVPEALVFQWVHEMFRRFNLLFTVLDSERIAEDEETHKTSAFAHNHLTIVALEWLVKDSDVVEQITDQSWDLLVMDEAHHIRWDQETPSPKWKVASELSKASDGLLLLTATPRQYGYDTLFGLLHLVDSERFSDFDSYVEEAEKSAEVAALAKEIYATKEISEDIKRHLGDLFPDDFDLQSSIDAEDSGEDVVRALVDRHGTGRALFRNRRARIKGFPKRTLFTVPLKPSASYISRFAKVKLETWDELKLMDCATGRDTNRFELDHENNDPRFLWIAEFIKNLGSEKALIICANRERVVRLASFLSEMTGMETSMFHEKLSVIERDQQAARFADNPKCQVLVSSEIGGEGRNFQFAHKLIMADIPRHPDLVEQRIGRLDRIGQKSSIEIYVPYLEGTSEEVLVKWYQEGIHAFDRSWNGTDIFLSEFVDSLMDVIRLSIKGIDDKGRIALAKLIQDTAVFAEKISIENENSVDILLDINSFDEGKGAEMLDAVDSADDDPALEFFMRSMLDHYGVEYDDYDERGSIVVHGESLKFIESFPGIEQDQDTVLTFSRETALAREDMVFLTGDHPIVEATLSLLLDRGEGMASMCKWEDSPYDRGLILESSWILEALGPRSLELGKYLPVQMQEIQMDHRGKVLNEARHRKDPSKLEALTWDDQQMTPKDMEKPLRGLLAKIEKSMEGWVEKNRSSALTAAKKELDAELERMEYLARVNKSVTALDVANIKERNIRILEAIKKAAPRLDAIRVIFTH